MHPSKDDPYAVHPKLAKLTPKELELLIERYYAGEKLTTLIQEFGLQVAPSQLVVLFPPRIHHDRLCPYCQKPMISRRPSRSNFEFKDIPDRVVCPFCQHEDYEYCCCPSCRKARQIARQEEEARKRRLIQEMYPIKPENRRPLASLTLRERVLLGALLRCGLEENTTRIKPLSIQRAKLSPLYDCAVEVLRSLYELSAIVVHPDSPIDAFGPSENAPYPERFTLDQVIFQVNVDSAPDEPSAIQLLTHPDARAFSAFKKQEFCNMWKDIALEECLEYLLYRLEQVGFPLDVGSKTATLFDDLLNYFSTAQIYCIIYKSIAFASASYLEKHMSKQQATNYAVDGCRRMGERYRANQWPVASYHRDFNCPQSALSQFFYDRVLCIGDEGFSRCPQSLLSGETPLPF